MSKLIYHWRCANCQTNNEEPLSKYEAAFFEALKLERRTRCHQCGGLRAAGSVLDLPDLNDPELLKAWMADRKLYFASQDEELYLAGIDSAVLVDLMTDDRTPRRCLDILLLALIYKTHDGRFADDEDARAAKSYLAKTRSNWDKKKVARFQIRKRVRAILDET